MNSCFPRGRITICFGKMAGMRKCLTQINSLSHISKSNFSLQNINTGIFIFTRMWKLHVFYVQALTDRFLCISFVCTLFDIHRSFSKSHNFIRRKKQITSSLGISENKRCWCSSDSLSFLGRLLWNSESWIHNEEIKQRGKFTLIWN